MTHTAAITSNLTRRPNEAYYTPAQATQQLLKRVHIVGSVLEPCAGNGAIADLLDADSRRLVLRSDVAWNHWEGEQDATRRSFWHHWAGGELPLDWVVTNPPFTLASKIIPLAYEYAQTGIAFLLRLSYLEPCRDRAHWLSQQPPSRLIVLPRISFSQNGRTDSTTTVWFVWLKHEPKQRIEVVPR